MKWIICFFLVFFMITDVYADYDYSGVQTVIRSAGADVDIEKAVEDTLKGKNIFDINYVFGLIKDRLFKELGESMGMMKSIVAICIIGAIFRCIGVSFERKGINETGFYVCYCSAVVMLIAQFKTALGILSDAVDTISETALASMPVFTGLLAVSGNVASARFFYPLVSLATGIFAIFIRSVFIPLINMTALLSMINFLDDRQILSKLSELLRKTLSILLKTMAILFGVVLSVHTSGTAVINSMLGKGVKTAVGFVPIVGDVFSGAFEGVVYMGRAVKSGFGMVMILVMILIGIVPFIKLICIFLIYKLTAVFAEPVSDKRITECIDVAGECMIPVIGAFFTVMLLSVMTIIMIMSISGV